jgi:FcoT-like thioesterase domain
MNTSNQATPTPTPPPRRELTMSPELVEAVLTPYRPQCRYLKQAVALAPTGGPPRRAVEWVGQFSIPESCYIDSTGHFNAVEANICVNQLGYLAIAWVAAQGAEHPYWGELGVADLEAFRAKQLANVLILSLSTSFRRVIDPRAYQCRLHWVAARRKKADLSLLEMSFVFTDQAGGLAQAEMLVGVT